MTRNISLLIIVTAISIVLFWTPYLAPSERESYENFVNTPLSLGAIGIETLRAQDYNWTLDRDGSSFGFLTFSALLPPVLCLLLTIRGESTYRPMIRIITAVTGLILFIGTYVFGLSCVFPLLETLTSTSAGWEERLRFSALPIFTWLLVWALIGGMSVEKNLLVRLIERGRRPARGFSLICILSLVMFLGEVYLPFTTPRNQEGTVTFDLSTASYLFPIVIMLIAWISGSLKVLHFLIFVGFLILLSYIPILLNQVSFNKETDQRRPLKAASRQAFSLSLILLLGPVVADVGSRLLTNFSALFNLPLWQGFLHCISIIIFIFFFLWFGVQSYFVLLRLSLKVLSSRALKGSGPELLYRS